MCAKIDNIYRNKEMNELVRLATCEADTGAMLEIAFRTMERAKGDECLRKEVFGWFDMAASNGELLGAEMLADCYSWGYGCKEDYELAEKWARDVRQFRKSRTDEELMEFCPASFMMEGIDISDLFE